MSALMKYLIKDESGVTAMMSDVVKYLINDEAGVTAIEYGMIAALIAVVIIGIISLLGTSLSTTFNNINSSL